MTTTPLYMTPLPYMIRREIQDPEGGGHKGGGGNFGLLLLLLCSGHAWPSWWHMDQHYSLFWLTLHLLSTVESSEFERPLAVPFLFLTHFQMTLRLIVRCNFSHGPLIKMLRQLRFPFVLPVPERKLATPSLHFVGLGHGFSESWGGGRLRPSSVLLTSFLLWASL